MHTHLKQRTKINNNHCIGLLVEGIFRMSGSAKRIGMLQQIFDSDHDFGAKFDWSSGGYTVHDAANVMRRFLNHLPEPVITLDYYRPFKDTMRKGQIKSPHCLPYIFTPHIH